MLYQWYQMADIALFPSFHEECGYVGIEMMMHGLPVVASDGFGVRCMFHDGINARIAKIRNRKKPREFENNLTSAILELLHDEALCKQLSKGARQVYKSCYTVERMQNKYRELLKI